MLGTGDRGSLLASALGILTRRQSQSHKQSKPLFHEGHLESGPIPAASGQRRQPTAATDRWFGRP